MNETSLPTATDAEHIAEIERLKAAIKQQHAEIDAIQRNTRELREQSRAKLRSIRAILDACQSA